MKLEHFLFALKKFKSNKGFLSEEFVHTMKALEISMSDGEDGEGVGKVAYVVHHSLNESHLLLSNDSFDTIDL